MNTKVKQHKKIRKGDKVIAIAGNARGQTGIVLSRRGERAIVQGLNVRKKAVKRSQANPQGGFLDLEAPIHVSNLKICTQEDKPVKLKVRKNKEGQRELYHVEEGREVKHRSIKKS